MMIDFDGCALLIHPTYYEIKGILMFRIENINEQNFVNLIRAKINLQVSSLIDTFSGWLIGGFGAAATLLVSQYESVSKHIGALEIQSFLNYFIFALVISIFQKYIAIIIKASSIGAMEGKELAEEFVQKEIKLDMEMIFREMEKSMLPVARCFVRRSFEKIRSGDLVSAFRSFTMLSQVQGLMTIVQAIITLFAIYKFASAFHA